MNFFAWLPPDISTHGHRVDSLLWTLHCFMAVLFLGWLAYFFYCLYRFRARPGHEAQQQKKNFRLPNYLELGILAFEVFLLCFVSSPLWNDLRLRPPATGSTLTLRVIAEQYAWNIHYPGEDQKFGATRPELIDGTNPVGLDREDPAAKDDLVAVNVLHIPVHQPVLLELTAKDVIHDFAVPALRLKQDIIPGMRIPLWFEAKDTGSFDIACAQLCGVGHYRMRGQLVVESESTFKNWLTEERKGN